MIDSDGIPIVGYSERTVCKNNHLNVDSSNNKECQNEDTKASHRSRFQFTETHFNLIDNDKFMNDHRFHIRGNKGH